MARSRGYRAILSNGRVAIYTGATPAGRPSRTILAQICADQLGVDVTAVDVGDGGHRGDAAWRRYFRQPYHGQRRLVGANRRRQVREKNLALAAAKFGVAESDLELADGLVRITGAQGDSISFAELAKMTSGMPGYVLPQGVVPDLEASGYFTPAQATYSNGSHVAVVEVDLETGMVTIDDYVVVHDCGNVINPKLVDGQVQGGVVHGIGNALLERMVYDADANPLTTTFADYLMPTAEWAPKCRIIHMESPTPLNPLGVKGAGEGGTIPVPAAIVAAVENALAPFDVHLACCPITPQMIVEKVQAARQQEIHHDQ